MYPTLSIELWRRFTPELIPSFLDRYLKTYTEMWGNGTFSTSHWKVIQHKRAFLRETPEPKLRPCSWNENSVNENNITYRQIPQTVPIGLNIRRGETPNTKQTKIMVRNNFQNFYSPNSPFLKFLISRAILQIGESKDR